MKKNNLQIGASILSGDFGNLSSEAKRIEKSGADSIHLDIMDGHFVPNLTMGPKAVAAINRSTDMFLDVHLMMYNPFNYIEKFIESGADRIIVHYEATENLEDCIDFVHRCGKEIGISINPETPESAVIPYLSKCDMILVMSVDPGFAGQKFLPSAIEKIQNLRMICNKYGISKNGKISKDASAKPFDIQVDGGIDLETGKLCVEAGANYLVSGSFLFKHSSLNEGVTNLRAVNG
ncbi:MAG TPA: ribulose-phosphate 3-epimerase [Chlamydiales bacterium]|nr:ribulose-phosphate 3-epimerase [Chlamydiales bacterium]